MNRYWTIASLFIAGLFGAFTSPAFSDSRNLIVGGDFEADSLPASWQVTGNVSLKPVSGVWTRFTCTFNSLEHSQALFQFYMPLGGIGSVWIDNLTVREAGGTDKPALINASFEDADDSVPGWSVSHPNVTGFIDRTRGSDGQSAFRITHVNEAVPWSGVSQQFSVKPATEYVAEFDIYIDDDFQGEARGLVFDVAGNTLATNFGEQFASSLVQLRERGGRKVAMLASAQDNPSSISQRFATAPDQNLSLSADLDLSDFDGKVQMIVERGDSKQIVDQKSFTSGSEDIWTSVEVSCASTAEGLTLTFVADGTGTVLLDNVVAGPPAMSPPVQQAKWNSAPDNFQLDEKLSVSITGKSANPLEGGLELLARDLAVKNVEVRKASAGSAGDLRIKINPSAESDFINDEAYRLIVDHNSIQIEARHESGAFYALITLLQLIQTHNGKNVVLACEINDYPDLPTRGILFGDPEGAARLKMNTLMLSVGHPSTPEQVQELHDLIRQYERLNLKVIPFFPTMTLGYYVQKINPNFAAGVQIKDEALVLNSQVPTELAKRQVIRTRLTDIVLTSSDKRKRYQLGKDYEIIDGDIEYPYSAVAPKPFAVVRTKRSAIPDGATVLATYDHVSSYRESNKRTEPHIPYVTLEPEAESLMGEYVAGFVKEFPIEYLHIMNCLEEFPPYDAQLETDSRVIRSRKKPIDLLVDNVIDLDGRARASNPDVTLAIWAGHMNQYAKAAGPRLPKTTLVHIWGYDAKWPDVYGQEAVEYWSKLGHETTVMPWNNLRCVRGWAQVVARARQLGYPCIGIIGSCWPDQPHPDAGMEETARVAWKIPKPGEPGYVELADAPGK